MTGVVHEPSLDDTGDFYVYIGGVRHSYGYWSREAAERCLDNALWAGMVIG